MPSLCTSGNTDISCQNTRKLKIHKSYEKASPAVLQPDAIKTWSTHLIMTAVLGDEKIHEDVTLSRLDEKCILSNSNSERDWFIMLCDKSYTYNVYTLIKWLLKQTCFKSPCSNFRLVHSPCPLCSLCGSSFKVNILRSVPSRLSLSQHLKCT